MTAAKPKRMGRPPRFTDAECLAIKAEHEAGASVRVLVAKHKAGAATIYGALARAGGTVRVRPVVPPAAGEVVYPGVRVVAASLNRKLGDAAATYVAAQTCPPACPFLNAGCYAEYDQTGLHWHKITAEAAGLTAEQLARAEAAAIRRTPAVRDLRLHVAGDSPTRRGTRLIADACAEYVARGVAVGKRLAAFGYTHAWRAVLRSDWWRVSILASCETAADVRAARRRGYAAAVTVAQFPNGPRAFDLDGEKCVPCPAQTGDATCTDCRLCMADHRLLSDRLTIAFEVHGSGAKRAAETVKRVALPMAG